ncbi:ORF6N domain-containing protein [Hyphobacterium sp. CCMP332]|nr:ORF6N domain-containing protein [Hyphobacterium sp. CCMP332]
MNVVKAEREIANQILILRGQKVLLDIYLSPLYEIETRVLKQQVKRNFNRFPDDFMLELNDKETELMVSQNVIPHKGVLGGAKPMAFTEQGIAMLSGVLNSKRAIDVNIAIMRTFVHLRKMFLENKELNQRIAELEKKYDEQFQSVFEAIKQLINNKSEPRKSIGFKVKNS